MRIVRPVAIVPTPSIAVLALGGLVGSLLALAAIYGAPVFGGPMLDVLRTIGGLFTADPDAALGIGAAVALLVMVVLPTIAQGAWLVMPGGTAGVPVHAAVMAFVQWAIVGVVAGLAGALGQWSGPGLTGWMGFGGGLAGVLVFGAASIAYGVAVAVVAWMEQGISPLDAIGWSGFNHASTGPIELGVHRSSSVSAPAGGERPWRGAARSQ